MHRAMYKSLGMDLLLPSLDVPCQREQRAFALVIEMYLDTHQAEQLCT